MMGKEISKAILVLGMHRSGTSAATRVLSLLGADLGADLISPARDNVKGFWEHKGVLAIHERLLAELECSWQDIRGLPTGWLESSAASKAREALLETLSRDFAASTLWAVKEPRLCRLLPLWLPLARELNVRFHALHISRHPDEIAASLRVRNGMSLEHTRLLWMQHVVEAHAASQDLPRAVLHFDELLSNWRGGVSAVAEHFNMDWPRSIQCAAPDIEDFLSPFERHHTITSPHEIRLPGLLQHLYDACNSPAGSVQWQLIDQCVARCQEALETMLPGFDLLQSKVDTLASKLSTAESTAHVLAQRNEGMLQALGWVASRLPGGMKVGGIQTDVAKLYYRTSKDDYSEERGATCSWRGNGAKTKLVFELNPPVQADYLRFDPADRAGEFEVDTVTVNGVTLALKENVIQANQYRLSDGSHGVRFGSGDNDPYVELALSTAAGKVRLVEVECRGISAADELAEGVEDVLLNHLEPQRQVLQEIHSLVKTEAERVVGAQLTMQNQIDVLGQRNLALLEYMQKGWFGRLRRTP